jgi:hypothetical protein
LAELDEESIALLKALKERQGGTDEVTLCKTVGLQPLRGRAVLQSLVRMHLVFSTNTVASPFPIYVLTPYGVSVLQSETGE